MASAPGDERGGDDVGDVEVAAGRRRGADAEALVGQLHGQRVGVGLGMDHDRADAELTAGADDAQGDLAAVGDQNSS